MTTSLPSMPYAPRSPEGLAARWVQWAATPSFFRSPIGDDTGARAALHQPDDVWFLAGSYGGDPVVRQCRVPVGRELFLPVFNTWFVDHGPEVFERAGGRLTVDGEDLTPEVIATPQPFVVRGGFLNGVTRSRKPTHMTVWGLWKLVPALGPGEHDLHVVGGDGYGFVVDVRYRLEVASPEAGAH